MVFLLNSFQFEGECDGKWKTRSVLILDPKNISVEICEADDVWLKPVKWNQAGYDAVYLLGPTVAFVQVTIA